MFVDGGSYDVFAFLHTSNPLPFVIGQINICANLAINPKIRTMKIVNLVFLTKYVKCLGTSGF